MRIKTFAIMALAAMPALSQLRPCSDFATATSCTIGSIAQVAAGGGWQTTIVALEMGPDPCSPNSNPCYSPVNFQMLFSPSLVVPGVTVTGDGEGTLGGLSKGGLSITVLSGDDSGPPIEGFASVEIPNYPDYDNNMDFFAIFRYKPTGQEAVVPLETRKCYGYSIVFNNNGKLVTGVAIANLSAQDASIEVWIFPSDNYNGENNGGCPPIGCNPNIGITNDVLTIPAYSHASFMLASKYGSTAQSQGTIEFIPPQGGRISVVGLRANGAALTTLPPMCSTL
jgi:hypothetical protein